MSDMESSIDSIDNELYEISPYPSNTADKVGITIKGSSEAFINAHKRVSDIMREKGGRYLVNGVEIGILDAPKNKSIIVEVKFGKSMSGKANIKIYGVNKAGFATLMVTKPKGIGYEYSKILAFKVIKLLMDGLIDESISEKDIREMKMKKNEDKKKVGNVICDLCHKKFVNSQGVSEKVLEDIQEITSHIMTDHVLNVRSVDDQIMDLEENAEIKDIKDIFNSLEATSWEENRYSFMEKENDKAVVMDIDNELKHREKLQDKKILRKQKKLEEEEMRNKEEKEKIEGEIREEEKKRKRQMSIEKKKNKKKAKKDKVTTENNTNIHRIDKKYGTLFSQVGLNIEELCLYVTKGDGACGANCVAVFYHNEEKLGPYVRRNINEHKIKFWSAYKDFISFPITKTVGQKQIIFPGEEEYLEFLKNDPMAGLIWIEHQDLQAICNMYQVPVHILTTGVPGMKDPAARWTHLEPDTRLKEAGAEYGKLGHLPELWLMHTDEIHFNLIIKKESMVAKEGCVDERKESEKVDIITENIHDSVKCDNDDLESGPGYMGWKVSDDSQTYQEEKQFLEKLSEVKASYEELKKNFVELKSDFETMKTKLEKKDNEKEKDDKAINHLKIEISKVKEEYKECLKAIKDETFARNKAEEEAKVLRATLEAHNDLKQQSVSEEMDTEEARNATFDCTICTEKYEDKHDLECHLRDHHTEPENKCSICNFVFKTPEDLQNHKTTHNTEFMNCDVCKITFRSNNELNNHLKTHKVEEHYKCELCENMFKDKKSFTDHAIEHVSNTSSKCNKSGKISESKIQVTQHEEKNERDEFKCKKCEKVYSSMSNLRRHDWRSHRDVKCNICDDRIESRQEIGKHRQNKHQIFRKTFCRFYPECLDGDECLFSHEQENESLNGAQLCPRGQTCSDQSCKFTEANHRNVNNILCKFQAKCSRKFCPFQHSVTRTAFLGEVRSIRNQM